MFSRFEGLRVRCGPNYAFEAQKELSAVPAPMSGSAELVARMRPETATAAAAWAPRACAAIVKDQLQSCMLRNRPTCDQARYDPLEVLPESSSRLIGLSFWWKNIVEIIRT
jgi:hypothetical protein